MKPQRKNPIWLRRVKMGLSMGQMAEKSKVSKSTIWNIENTYYDRVRLNTIAKLAKTMKIKPGTLVDEYLEWRNESTRTG